MDGSVVLGIAGFVVTMTAFGFTIVRVLDGKAERRQTRAEMRHDEEMASIRKEINEKHASVTRDIHTVHNRVNDVKDRYVKQETHDRDISQIHRSISEFRSEMKTEIHNGLSSFNASISELRGQFTGLLMDISRKLGNPPE